MKELYIDEHEKWKTRELRQILPSVAESRASTLDSSIVYRHDFLSIIPTGSAVYLAQFPHPPFYVLIYI